MKARLDTLIREGNRGELPVSPLAPERQERILTMTMKRIESEQKQTYHRGRRPVTILVAVAAAIALLCGSVFAAYELNLFNFSRLFGENTEIIEDAVITYEPTSTEAVPATGGYAAQNHVTAEDYNFTLLGEVTASAKLLYATIDVSRVSEDVPVFADSGLTLGIDGYEARTFYRGVGMTDRIVVYATLDEPLTEGATLDFTLTGSGGNTVLLENTPVTISEANAVVFANPDPNAAYVLDTASITHTDLTVTGHFQTVEADYATALDASGTIAVGSIPWPLYDRPIEEYDPEDGEYHEDMEGYLVLRDVQNDGTFTLEWTFIKNFVDFGTVTFCGVDYEIPEIEQEIALEEYVPTFATSAETQDYRFSLETMVASPSVIYAVVDMEPITDYGAAHMDQQLSIALSDLTNIGDSTLNSVLLESENGINRYLSYVFTADKAVYQTDDVISFEVWGVTEAGDTADHSYHLFDAKLDTIITATASTEYISGDPSGDTIYTEVTINPLSMNLMGNYENNGSPKDAFGPLEVILTFKDGSSYTIMDESWHPSDNLENYGDYGAVLDSVSADGDEFSGTIYRSILFSQVVSLEELDTVTVDGQVFQVNYEIG